MPGGRETRVPGNPDHTSAHGGHRGRESTGSTGESLIPSRRMWPPRTKRNELCNTIKSFDKDFDKEMKICSLCSDFACMVSLINSLSGIEESLKGFEILKVPHPASREKKKFEFWSVLRESVRLEIV